MADETKLTPTEEQIVDMIVDYTRRTKDTAEGVTGWGGYREGAGRPSTGRKRKFYYVTDQEDAEIKKLLQQLREG